MPAPSASGIKAGKAFVEITLDNASLKKGLDAAKKKISDFSTSMTSVGKELLLLSGVAAAPLAMATKTFADFDDSMRMVQAVTGATGKEFEKLTAQAEKLGRETSYTAKQVAEGMVSLGRMGLNAQEIQDAIPSVLSLARATGTDLAQAGEIATNNMRVFGIETSKMSNVADILTATANGSAQTLVDLGEALKMAGPQAAAANDNITNVSGALGVLANMGIKGSLAGTALRKAYSQFAKTDVQGTLKEIGISTTDANGNLRAMPAIMADIAKQMNAMPTAKRLAFAEEIFDLRGSLAGLQLGGNIKQLDAFIERLKNVGGVADEQAKKMDAGIGGTFRIFMSALEGIQIAVGKVISSAIQPYVDSFSKSMNQVAEFIQSHERIVIVVMKAIGVIAAAGATLVALGLVLKTVSLAFGVLSSALTTVTFLFSSVTVVIHTTVAAFLAAKVAAIAFWGSVTGPAVLAVAALGAVIAAVTYLSGAWEMLSAGTSALAGNFSESFGEIRTVVSETLTTIKTALKNGDLAGAAKTGLSALKVAWLTGLKPLRVAWADLKQFLADSWSTAIFGLLKLGNDLWFGLRLGLLKAGVAIADAWTSIWGGIVESFYTTIKEIEKAWIKLKGTFDSEEEVNARIQAVEEEYEASKEARRKDREDVVSGRRREVDQLREQWDNENAKLDAGRTRELLQNQEERDQAVSGLDEDIASAKEEWKSAADAVRASAEEASRKVKATKAKTAGMPETTANAMANIEDFAASDKHAVGGFASDVVNSALGGSSAQERTANAAERIVTNTEKTNKLLKGQKTLVYS